MTFVINTDIPFSPKVRPVAIFLSLLMIALSSCSGVVPEGLKVPKVVEMREMASASDVTVTCVLTPSGGVDGCVFILSKDGTEISRQDGTKGNDGSYSCVFAGLRQDSEYSWFVEYTNGKDEALSDTRSFLTERLPYDPVLWEAILEEFDSDGDGRLSEGEKLVAKEFTISDIPLNSLSGIEELEYLETLYLGGNGLKEPDFSGLPNLETLSCGRDNYQRIVFDNPKLSYIYIIGTPLKGLDTSRLPLLWHLDSYGNPFETLDFSTNPALWQIAMSGSSLEELDLSSNPKIGILYLKENDKLRTVWLAPGCEPDEIELPEGALVKQK